MTRCLPLLLALLIPAALAMPASAAAEDESIESAKDENQQTRLLVDQAVDATESGDRERGYELARTAYLDHFEKVEIPLRLRNPNLVLDLEFDFAKLRDGIRSGESIGEIKETEGAVRAGLDDVERELSDPGVAATPASESMRLAKSCASLVNRATEA